MWDGHHPASSHVAPFTLRGSLQDWLCLFQRVQLTLAASAALSTSFLSTLQVRTFVFRMTFAFGSFYII